MRNMIEGRSSVEANFRPEIVLGKSGGTSRGDRKGRKDWALAMKESAVRRGCTKGGSHQGICPRWRGFGVTKKSPI